MDARHDTGRGSSAHNPQTWPEPAATLTTTDPRYGTVTVHAWHRTASQDCCRTRPLDQLRRTRRSCSGTVIRVEVEHLPKPTARTKKTLWLWWSGPGEPDLDRCWRAYLRRFDIEHTFRFAKNTLGWTTPSLCTPEQADRDPPIGRV